MRMRLHRFDLQLKHPFTISRGTVTVQPTLIVELIDECGKQGFGEATENDFYGHTVDSMIASLESVRGIIERASWNEPRDLWERLAGPLGKDSFAMCAVDQAAYDLWGERQGKRVRDLLGFPSEVTGPRSNFTIGLDSPETMVAKLRETPNWPAYKIKLGTPNDVELLERLRRDTTVPFRVDANGGWTLDQALERIESLERLGVELIEQPFSIDQSTAVASLRQRTRLPVFADESCQIAADVIRCADLGFSGINIKLVKCGGLTPALRMIEEARRLGLALMVGCMTESSVGISAIAQLLPALDFVDMDGAALLSEDVADGIRVERGVCHWPKHPGSGVVGLRASGTRGKPDGT